MVNIRRGIVAPPVLIDINSVTELRGITADAQALSRSAPRSHSRSSPRIRPCRSTIL